MNKISVLFYRIISGLIVCFFLLPTHTYAQPVISHADGSPLQSSYCPDDKEIQIEGTPTSGIFNGCGVYQRNGNWYFNPSATAGVTNTQCRLRYYHGGDSAVRNVNIHHKILLTTRGGGIVCRDSFYLFGDMLNIGAYFWEWSAGPNMLTPDRKGTWAVLPPGSREAYVFYAENLNTGCFATDTLIVETKPVLDFRFTNGDMLVETGTTLLLETNANRGYRVSQWLPAPLFTDQTAISQTITPDTSILIRAIAQSDDGCIDTAKMVITTGKMGIPQEDNANRFYVYPNPAQHTLYITDGAVPANVRILDMTGKTVLFNRVVRAGAALDIRSLAPGRYFIRVEEHNGNPVKEKSAQFVKMAW